MAVNHESQEDLTNKVVKSIEGWINDGIKSIKTYFKDKSPMEYIKAETLSLFDKGLIFSWKLVAVFALIMFMILALVYQIAWKVAAPPSHLDITDPSLMHNVSPISSPPKYTYDTALKQSAEESLNKLFSLHSSGDIEAFESELLPIMQDYCVLQLGPEYLDEDGFDSMHINLAESIAFIAEGNHFSTHFALTVTPDGGIVDPFDFDRNPRGSKSCPLLDAVLKKAKELMLSNVATSEDEHDFLEVATHYLTTPDELDGSQCHLIMETFRRERVRSLLTHWAGMVDIISRETKEQFPKGIQQDEWETFYPDPESTEYRKYVIGRDGSIMPTEDYGEIEGRYLWCEGIEFFLNTKFVLLDGYTYTNIKMGLDETFDQWYEDTLDKMQIDEP